MDSVVLTLKDFLCVCENNLPKGKVVIPLYQRPYTWEDRRIVDLLHDLFKSKKFLGIIILDENNSYYELIDGQQRITTCILLLAALHNKLSGKPIAQQIIRRVLFPGNVLRVKNESVSNSNFNNDENSSFPGEYDYLAIRNDRIELNISEDDDIYYQKNSFAHAMAIIEEELDSFLSAGNIDLYNQILACTVLVIVKKQADSVAESAEQVFLDINEKAQKLTAADIFKGHCFKIYDPTLYQELKNQWSNLLKYAVQTSSFFTSDLSSFLYLYLIGIWNDESALSVTEELTLNESHILTGKDVDFTHSLLEKIIAFGENIFSFWNCIQTADYYFSDLCVDSEAHKFEIVKINTLKALAFEIIQSSGTARYQKLPFFSLIHYLKQNNSELGKEIDFADLMVLFSDCFIYSSLFLFNVEKRSKSNIDTTIRRALDRTNFTKTSLLEATKELRRIQQDKDFSIEDCGKNFEKQAFAFSIIDFYNARTKVLCKKYQRHDSENHNQEHFVVPQNNNIVWKLSDAIQLDKAGREVIDQTTGQKKTKKREVRLQPIPTESAKQFKQQIINYIILPEDLNGSIKSFDIVYKIQKIEDWYRAPGRSIPKHIGIIINKIRCMSEYQELERLKASQETILTVGDMRNEDVKSHIQEKYNAFLSAYFAEENKTELQNELKVAYESCLPKRAQLN